MLLLFLSISLSYTILKFYDYNRPDINNIVVYHLPLEKLTFFITKVC